MKKVLITGSNGLLGQATVRLFRRDFDVIGCDTGSAAVDYFHPPQQYLQLDLTNRERVKSQLSILKPDIIINTSAFTNVDECESKTEACWSINAKAIEEMIDVSQAFSPLFVQISTDYVFDGNNGPYREIDTPKPLGYYGLSKYAAEKTIRNSDLEYIIARSMILFGWGKDVRLNFVTWVVDQLKKRKKIRVVNDQVGNPTFTDDCAEALLRLIRKEEYGLFHIAGNEICNRFEFACKIADTFELDRSLIQEIKTSELAQKAPRPMNSSFVLDKLSNTIDWLPSKLTDALKKLKSQLQI
jgi:dTDP-4-dehydrorhamnose reductase